MSSSNNTGVSIRRKPCEDTKDKNGRTRRTSCNDTGRDWVKAVSQGIPKIDRKPLEVSKRQGRIPV